MIRKIQIVFFILFSILKLSQTFSFEMSSDSHSTIASGCALQMKIEGAITVATLDYLERGFKEMNNNKCIALFLEINTPGGNLQTTRTIIEKLLAIEQPVLCLIAPQGAHAGSAGAIIMQACLKNAGLPSTNIGAATPIFANGKDIGPDLRQKVLNDTISWVEGLAKLRGRNTDFAREIVEKGLALDIETAVKRGAVDYLVHSKEELFQKVPSIKVNEVVDFIPDARFKLLNFICDPEMAYLIFMISLALLYFEVTNPGWGAPGVIGVIGMILSLIAFQKLDVSWGGVVLIFVGIGLLVAEIFITSFGLLAIGGIVSLIAGSIFVFDPERTGHQIPWGMILGVVTGLTLFLLGIGYLLLQTFRLKKKDEFIGQTAIVDTVLLDANHGSTGYVFFGGELWRYESLDSLTKGDQVTIIEKKGLVLKVKLIS